MQNTRLQGKAALVTGGTSGIGRSIVERLSCSGVAVVFTGRDRDRGEEVAASTGATFVRADALDESHARTVVEATLRQAGRLDILVNNAGSSPHRDRVEDVTREALDTALGVHLRAPWFLMAAAVEPMRRAGGGSIVNICSVAGHRIGAASVAYSVAKAGLLHLTRCAAADFGKYNIRVNSVSPGFIATSIHTPGFDPGTKRADSRVATIGRLFATRQALDSTGQPEDVADAVLYLASPDAHFITGTDLVVDGGLMWGQAAPASWLPADVSAAFPQPSHPNGESRSGSEPL